MRINVVSEVRLFLLTVSYLHDFQIKQKKNSTVIISHYPHSSPPYHRGNITSDHICTEDQDVEISSLSTLILTYLCPSSRLLTWVKLSSSMWISICFLKGDDLMLTTGRATKSSKLHHKIKCLPVYRSTYCTTFYLFLTFI